MTGKHVSQRRVTWTVRSRDDASQPWTHGRAEALFDAGRITTFRVHPSPD